MSTTYLPELYQRLQNYELDDPSHEFGFTRHLIKNHGWTEAYAQRAIAEYKKFAFLTVVANHQIVPCDVVDQVWHAHLLLTESYWEEFCPQVLRKKLHHHPARGGKAERAEFHQLYRQTIASYRQYFGNPPGDIWSPPEIRFGKELKMKRLSTIDNWIVSRSLIYGWLRWLSSLSAIAITIVFISQKALASSTVEADSYPIAISICLSLLVAVDIVLYFQLRQPKERSHKPLLSLYQVAYLSGGKSRVVETAIAKLVSEGYLKPNIRYRTFTIAKHTDSSLNQLELETMAKARLTPEFRKLKSSYLAQTFHLETSLEKHQLITNGVLRFAFTSFTIALTYLCLRHLSSISIFLAIFISIALSGLLVHNRTFWGDRMLKDLTDKHSFDPIQRFALYGETALSGGALDDLAQIYKAQKEADTGGCGCGC